MNFMFLFNTKGAALHADTEPTDHVEHYASRCKRSVSATFNSAVVDRKFHKERTSQSVDFGKRIANRSSGEINQTREQLN